jgi:D-lactate dehydrogenase
MKIAVYSYKALEKSGFEGLEEEYGIELVYCQDMPKPDNLHLAQGADAVSMITTPLTEAELKGFNDLGVRYISTRTVGYDHIDIDKAQSMGMGIGHATYAPGSVAEYTMMLILMATRKASHILNTYKRQDYALKESKLGQLVGTKTVGVVGTGRIGTAVVNILSGFGCEILVCDPYENEAVKKQARYVSFDELIKESDVISLHAPSIAENRHLINAASIEKMKDGVIIINTARGDLINTGDLIRALESQKIGFAALDVLEGETPVYYHDFEGQPIPLKNIEILSQFENVLLTPHTAFFTEEAIEEMARNSIKSCVLELRGSSNPWKIV